MKDKLIFFVISIFIFCPMCTLAEETTTAVTCSYATKANLNKLAGNVDASYEIIKDDAGTVTFRISIYNIVEGIYADVSNDYDNYSTVLVTSSDSTNGVYSFDVQDDTNIIKYTIVIRSNIEGCTMDLRKITLIKPKKNKFYDYDICKYDDVKDYSYCQEYITSEFTLSDDKIIEKIEEQRKIEQVLTTTKCLTCDPDYVAKLENIEKYKLYATIGFSIGISLDMIYIYYKVSTIKRSEL